MTMPVNEVFKAPADVLDYLWNWSYWLPAGDSIASSSFTADSGITIEVSPAASHTTSSSTVWLGGGTADQTYSVTCQVVTTGGRTAQWSTTVVVQAPLVSPSAPRIITVPENESAIMSRTAGKYGLRLPAPGRKWELKLRDYMDITALPPIPAGSFGHMNMVTSSWGMLMNDTLGCCVIAGAEHEHMLWGAESYLGQPIFNNACTVKNYEAIGGYQPGHPETDQGCDMLHAAQMRMHTGILDASGQRHFIGAALELDCTPGHLNMDQFWYAAWLFDGLGLGIQVTKSWERDFADGKPWDGADYNINDVVGGHYVPVMAREDDNGQFSADVVTWGQHHPITVSGLQASAMTVLVYVTQEKLHNGVDMEGLGWADLQSDAKKIQAL